MAETCLVLDIGGGHFAAIGLDDVVDVLERPNTTALPFAPDYCNSLLYRRTGPVPILDIPCLLSIARRTTEEASHVLVVSESSGPLQTSCVAIRLSQQPQRVEVINSPANLPSPAWILVASRCVDSVGLTFPLLSARHLCGPPAWRFLPGS